MFTGLLDFYLRCEEKSHTLISGDPIDIKSC